MHGGGAPRVQWLSAPQFEVEVGERIKNTEGIQKFQEGGRSRRGAFKKGGVARICRKLRATFAQYCVYFVLCIRGAANCAHKIACL